MLTKAGFKRKTLVEYLEEMQEQARELFGADVNLSDRSPLGQWIMLIAYGRAQESMLAEAVWMSGHIDDAEGVSLDHNAKKIGISRMRAEKSSGQATLEVEAGASVASGMILATESGVEFVTTASASDENNDGFITVPIEALFAGKAGNVQPGSIVEINTPVAGITAVVNSEITQNGADVESDAEFRERYYRSLANAGGASMPSIEAALLELPGVIDASVTENDLSVEANGLPPNSIAPFIYGGDDADIANAIFNRKTGGIQSFGTSLVTITDSKNKQHIIGFSRPITVDVWVRLTIQKNPEYQQYPIDGDALVASRIIEYVGGVDADGTRYDGQGLDGDIIHYKLIAAIGDIPGINDVSVELSSDGITYNQSNIQVNNISIAQTEINKVVIQ